MPMIPRVRDRLRALEAQILPVPQIYVFFRVEEPDLPPYAEQLAVFKAEKSVRPHDILAEVVVTFA
jgi:hypothetical protein